MNLLFLGDLFSKRVTNLNRKDILIVLVFSEKVMDNEHARIFIYFYAFNKKTLDTSMVALSWQVGY